MMQQLLLRGERIVRAAQRRRLEQIAGEMSARGILTEIGATSVICRGTELIHKWLTDPLLRFAGRAE